MLLLRGIQSNIENSHIFYFYKYFRYRRYGLRGNNLNNKRKSIAIVVTIGATAKNFVFGFARYLAERGFEVTVLADGLDDTTSNIGQGVLSTRSIAMVRDPSPVNDLKSLVSLIKTLKQISPDILLYGTPKASLLTATAGWLLRVPTRVYQLWGLRLETVTGLKRVMLSGFESLISRFSTKILANSQSLADSFTNLKLNSGKKVDVIGEGSSHGVDLGKFTTDIVFDSVDEVTRKFVDSRPNALVVGFVGRLHEDKGINTLLESVRLVRAQGMKVNLLLIGSDEGAEIGLNHENDTDTLLVGRVEDPRPYYSIMDLIVLPSLREGFPNVILESAAMKVPAVVSDGTGVVDSVVDGETGLVIPVGDARGFADAIRKLAVDSELRVQMGIQSRARVEKYFEQKDVWLNTLNYVLGP